MNNEKPKIIPTKAFFPDGQIWVHDHILKRIVERDLDKEYINNIIRYAKTHLAKEIESFKPYKRFILKSKNGRFGIVIAKDLFKGKIRYVVITAHPTLRISPHQTILYFESTNADDLNVYFHDKLNPVLFDSSHRMSPLVRKKLLKIAEDFKASIGVELPQLKDITISGSNAAYTYTPKSDIDLHLIVDLPEADNDETWRQLFDAKKFQYNEQHDYKIKGYDVELYVQNANEVHISQGIYSVLNDSWVKEPEQITADYDEVSTRSKYDQIRYLIQKAVEVKDYHLADKLRQTIKKYRQVGLHSTGEFGPENLAFKALRANGYIKKLYDLLNTLKDKEFSLENHEQRLIEVDMSPSTLQKFSASDIAQNTTVGFEFEMIVPYMKGDELDPEPDYDYDGYVDSGSIDSMTRDLINFFSETATSGEIKRAVEKLNENILEFMEEEFQQYLRDNEDDVVIPAYKDYTNLETDEEIRASFNDEDGDYDKVVDKLRDDFYQDWNNLDGALANFGMEMYSDWDNEYNFGWPHYTDGSSDDIDSDAMKEVANEIKNAVGMPIKSAAGYHAFGHKEPGIWYLETDSSIDAEGDEGGLELVSPPMPLAQAMEKLDVVFKWMQGRGAMTNSSTGFHMGVSIPEMENLDHLKLILFLGDKYVLDQFGRIANSYTRSSLGKMEVQNAPDAVRQMPNIFETLRKGLDDVATELLGKLLVPKGDRYVSVNIKDNYIEFRSAGGNYLEQIDKIKNTMLRYVRVMAIASNANEAKQEYAKKLYKLLATAAANEKDLDVIKWFTMYSSGNIAKAELVAKLKQAQARRTMLKGTETSWTLIGMYDRPVTIVKAKTEQEAWTKGREWEKSNPVNGGLRGIRQSTEDDIQQLTAASNSEPAGPWQRWIVYGTGDDGRNVRLTAVSARDRQEASRLAFRWGRDNNRVVTGIDRDITSESNRPTSLAGYIAESDKPFIWSKTEEKPKQKFTDWHMAHILGGHLYEGE